MNKMHILQGNLQRNKRGQVFSMDVGLSAVVFLIALIFLLSLWNIYARQLQETTLREEMELLTFQIMDLLVTTPGVPNNWEELNGSENQGGGGSSSGDGTKKHHESCTSNLDCVTAAPICCKAHGGFVCEDPDHHECDNPSNWAPSGTASEQRIYALGLAPKDRSLSKAKINKFFSLNYVDVKKYLNVERYELSFSLSYINGTVLNQTISPRSNESTQQMSVTRLVMDGNEPRQAQLMLWGK